MIRQTLQDTLADIASEAGIGSAIPMLLAEARECIHIVRRDGSPSRLGASRIGGVPDLPPSVEWPMGRRADQANALADFLVQLSFAELPPIGDMPLPRVGHAWLFVQDVPLKGPEISVTALHSPETETPLQPREIPDRTQWLLGEPLRPVSIGFEPGISLPFGRLAFRERLAASFGPLAWNDLAGALEDPEALGQIGGYAYDGYGDDIAKTFALFRLGRTDLWGDCWDSMAELEESIVRVPAYIRTAEELAAWRASYDPYRPKVQWLESHRAEANAWRLFLRLDPSVDTGFSLGDEYSLWFMIRNKPLALDLAEMAATMGSR